MWRFIAVIGIALVMLVSNPVAASPASLDLGPLSVELGMTVSQVEDSLGKSYELRWGRDLVPGEVSATETEHGPVYEGRIEKGETVIHVNDSDQHGERAFIASRDEPSEILAFLTFENDELVRANEILESGTQVSGARLVETIASSLARWDPESDGVSVEASDLREGETEVQQIVFDAGDLQLIVLKLDDDLTLVQNLGRGDIPVVSTAP